MAKVFISHASQDLPRASEIKEYLTKRGHKVWLDRDDLKPGQLLLSTIGEGFDEADVCLVIYSQHARQSGWVSNEIDAAFNRSANDPNFTLILALADDSPVPYLLAQRKWVHLADIDRAMAELDQALGTPEVPEETNDLASVWYFDDDPIWIDKFADRHEGRYAVRGFTEPALLLGALGLAVREGHLPDILLIDLHAIRADAPAEMSARARSRVRELVQREHDLKRYVDAAWHPAGVDIVSTVRDFYRPDEVPIAMHTQQGLILLRDDLIRRLELLKVGWLIKNRFSPESDRMVLQSIARNSGHRRKPGSGRPRALIVDDNEKYIEEFKRRQEGYFDIRSITSEYEVLDALDEMADTDGLPDIFLVDMYYPYDADHPTQAIEVGNQKLAEFAEFEQETMRVVTETFEPLGLEVLREVRALVPSPAALPILIYTVSGLVTIGDQNFKEINRLRADWMLKDRYGAATEEVMIGGQILRSQSEGARLHAG